MFSPADNADNILHSSAKSLPDGEAGAGNTESIDFNVNLQSNCKSA